MPKFLTLRDGRRIALNTPEEEAAINAAVKTDPDTYLPTDEELRNLRKAGRPKAAVTKERITIRLSPEVVERFRASGPGWQTRIDAALKDWLNTHKP
jgi:uncharacterized protein (DUF4415 family)